MRKLLAVRLETELIEQVRNFARDNRTSMCKVIERGIGLAMSPDTPSAMLRDGEPAE